MAPASFAFRLDPFAPEFEAALQLNEAEEPTAAIDAKVERSDWEAVRPPASPSSVRVFFVDGVRRVDHRLVVEGEEGSLFGLLGSFGVGAACLEGRSARVSHEHVGRLCVVGGGTLVPRVTAPVPGGRFSLGFEPRLVPENTPLAPLVGLQTAMREDEARLAETLGAEGEMVVLDGPLTFLGSTTSPIVGLVKRLIRSYLPVPEAGLLRRLEVGARTPVFLIQDARAPRYSWYMRLAQGRAIQAALTGVVRLEASGALPLAQAVSLADASCRVLPRLASDAAHDPRAPSNLVPIGGLEQRLRRLLGDPLLIRRSIESWLMREVSA